MSDQRDRVLWGALFLGGLVLLAFGFQGSRGLYSPDEGYYVGIAQTIFDTGEWLIPRLQHVPWLDKPPLSLWGIAAGLELFGQSEWGARAFHALLHVLTTLLVFGLGSSMGTRRDGWLAATMYATMVIPLAAANVVTPDSPLVFWTTAAFLCFWQSVKPEARRVAMWKLLMCAAFGLGFLTKGPAALIPSAAMFGYLVARRQVFSYFFTIWALPGVALFAALGLGWYAYVSHEVPGALAYFWDNQVFGRTVSSKYARNPGLTGALIYVPVVLLGTLPWSSAWWVALWKKRDRLMVRAMWTSWTSHSPTLLLGLWIAIPLAVLSLASSKLPLYALPVFPALALATTRLIPRREDSGNPLGISRMAMGMTGIWVIALLGIKWGGAQSPSNKDMRALSEQIGGELPMEQCEIVAVDDHLEGLGFYLPVLVEQVTTAPESYPFFVDLEQMKEEIEEFATSDYAHFVICRRESVTNQVRSDLDQMQVVYQERALGHGRTAFICEAAGEQVAQGTDPDGIGGDDDLVRLVALWGDEEHVSEARRALLVSTLRLLHGDRSFGDGVILMNDIFEIEDDENLTAQERMQRCFDVPFAPLTQEGIPFFGVSTSEGVDQSISTALAERPLLHLMGEQRISQGFGEGMVEVFFLDTEDSTTPLSWKMSEIGEALAASTARWKVVALPDLLTGAALHPEHVQVLIDHGASFVLQDGALETDLKISCLLPTGLSGNTAGSHPLSGIAPLLLDSDECGFVLLEFDDQVCHLVAYDYMGNVIDEEQISENTSEESLALPETI